MIEPLIIEDTIGSENENSYVDELYQFEQKRCLRVRILKNMSQIDVLIEDITHIVEQKNDFLRDQLEQAMEANFSHESLTPLNNITNNQRMIYNDLKSMKNGLISKKVRNDLKQCMNLASQALCSSQILHCHTNSQLLKMKYLRGKLQMQLKESDPEIYLQKMVQAFEIMITKANLDVKITNNCKTLNDRRVKIVTDWDIYQSIVFNITQNAIKYNVQDGKVSIELSFTQETDQDVILMNTLVSDTGIGIDEQRREFMFKIFGELLAKGQLSQVKDHAIGLGLSNSMLFTKALGGQLQIIPQPQNKHGT